MVSPALSQHYCTHHGSPISNPYTSCSIFLKLRQGWPGLNLKTLNVIPSPSSPSRHLASGFFKHSIAQSSRSFICSPNVCCRCSEKCIRLPHPPHLHRHTREVGTRGKCTIWSVSKSGSALHATISSDIAERAPPAGSSSVFVADSSVSRGYGRTTVSSVSFGHAATNPEVRSSRSLSLPYDPTRYWTTYGTDWATKPGGSPTA